MRILETSLPAEIQNEEGIVKMPARKRRPSVTSNIRHLPFSYTVMRNIAAKQSTYKHGGREEDIIEHIYIRENSVFKRIRINDIYLVEGLCDYINIYTREKRYTIHSTMYAILEKLPVNDFMRVHRSYIVRMDCISSIEGNMLAVETRKIPVSKTYKEEFISRLKIINH